MRGWSDLGVVDTIYEDEHEDSSPSLSFSSPPSPLQPWSMTSRGETDVLIYVQGVSFHLNKDALSLRSNYLKRQLLETSQITLSPPLNLTADTFSLVVNFCHGTDIVLTPFNVASLRTAAELLEMADTDGAGDENLRQKTESYFRREVAVNSEYATVVLRSCLKLLPEAETTAFLVSRCIEAINSVNDGILGFIDDVITVSPQNFEVIASSLRYRLTESHDLLYRLVDFYIKEHKGKLSEDEKNGICNSMECTMLSPQLLMHAVQNPRLPLRFIVHAMFIEQLNTRRSIVSSVTHLHHQPKPHEHDHDHDHNHNHKDAITLGVILQRGAALRQAAQLRATMEATASRIQGLEKELEGMKRVLHDQSQNPNLDSGNGRSASFRFSWERKKIERGERGSESLASLRSRDRVMVETSSDEGSSKLDDEGLKKSVEKGFGRKLMNGLKSVLLRASSRKKVAEKKSSKGNIIGDDDDQGNESVIVIKKNVPFHKRSHSFSN